MNPLVKKEIRLLLPGFLIGVALTFVSWLFNYHGFESNWNWFALVASFIACPMMAVFMALNSFGAEINAGTFSMLLSQPVSRLKIWQTKISLLAVALLVFGVLWFSPFFYLRTFLSSSPDNFKDLFDLFACVVMFALVVFSGALWTVLLMRQVAAAFWFTLIVPGAIAAISVGLFSDKSDEFITGIVVSALGIYSLGGFFYARWLFLRAQDAAWTGGTIVLPEMRWLKWWGERPREPLATSNAGSSVASPHRTWRPKAALFWKELQLHQSQFVLAGALALLHLGVIATRKFGHFQPNSSLEFILEQFWLLWLVMPLLVGCAAVAEERKMGTLESQLCLPVKRRTQFWVKLRVVLLLSVLFGVVVPLLLEGTRILPDYKFDFAQFFMQSKFVAFSMWGQFGLEFLVIPLSSLPLLTLVVFSIGVAVIAFYASTLARNTLQTLAPAVLGILTTCFLFAAAYLPEEFIGYPLWRGPLFYPIGLPVMVLVLMGLAFWNFKRVPVGWSVWRRNLLTLFISLTLVMMVTTALYHRIWEKLTPFEPRHGAARLSLSNPATLREQWSTLSVRLPDGRIWTDDYTLNSGMPNPLALFLGDIRLTSMGGEHFLNGSNWITAIGSVWFQQAGIKTDGTLWISEKPVRRKWLATGGPEIPKAGNLMHFGSETNWNSIVQNGLSMLLVKNDGTLWRWGTTDWDFKRDEWPGLQSFTPYRLGTESNWAEIFLVNYELCLCKTDGSTWTPWDTYRGNEMQKIELEPGFFVGRSPLLRHSRWRGTTTADNGLKYQLGVRDNGTFRIWADQRLNNQSHFYEWTATDLQFGKETNWLAVTAGRNGKIVTLKNDGTLWLWPFYYDSRRGEDPDRDEREMLNVKPVRLGTHSDWIGIADIDGGIISLAADGSLWYWPLESASYFMGEFGGYNNAANDNFEPLLDISRKPQLLGNVFGTRQDGGTPNQ